jgi:aryl-alcohol dehydrogenase-like predicted oxidoreductase
VTAGGSMDQRPLGRTGLTASVVGLGTWQLGADWGEVPEAAARDVLETSLAEGVTFFDTADVYGDGRSERVLGGFLADHADDRLVVATKMGRRAAQVPESYVAENFRTWIDRSRKNLGVDRLQLVQLHCPPSEVIDSDATFDALDELVEEGAVAAYGVSVETVDQALDALTRPYLASVQVILNAFRLKPLDRLLRAAAAAQVAVIARVPLASGLLSGRYGETTSFASDDHRSYNRDGSAFDVGETFSGVGFETGVVAAREFRDLVRAQVPGATSAQAAIAWVLQQTGVTTVIPGARSAGQARANAQAAGLGTLSPEFLAGVREIYDEHFRASVHPRW